MGKGTQALAYLPQVDLILPTGNVAASTEAFKQLAGLIERMQSDSPSNVIADGTYTAIEAGGNNPYDSSIWTIVVASTAITCTFVSESVNQDLGQGRAALTARRAVDLLRTTSVNHFTMRSFKSLIEFVESVEDRVARSGSGATGDATYTDYPINGSTPFETYTWTVVKLADLYTLTSTATS